MVFTEPDLGVIGVAVRGELALDGPLLMSAPVVFDAAFLEIPFQIDPDGDLRLGSSRPIDTFDLWPVHPTVEAYISGDEVERANQDDDQASCAVAARMVADHFLRLHESECGGDR